jgi:hypothetical protein
MPKRLQILNLPIVSYCEIPENIADTYPSLQEGSCDSYIKHSLTKLEEREKYDDDWILDDWILKTYPKDVKPGDDVLIHLDC